MYVDAIDEIISFTKLMTLVNIRYGWMINCMFERYTFTSCFINKSMRSSSLCEQSLNKTIHNPVAIFSNVPIQKLQ